MSEESIFCPEFIPFYVEEVRKYKLTPTEGLIYGFIRFYTKLKNNGFFFKSEQLSEIIQVSVGTIDNCIGKLKEKGLLKVETNNIGFRKVRKIFLNLDEVGSSSYDEVLDFTIGGTSVFTEKGDKIIINKNKNNKENNKRKNIKKEKSFFNFFEDLKILKNYNFDFKKFVDKNGENIFGNELFCQELVYFYEMRKEIKAPMSARALELLCLKVRNYDLNIFIKMIQQSTENSWKGIFDLKDFGNNSLENEKTSAYEKQEAETMERFKKFKQEKLGSEK